MRNIPVIADVVNDPYSIEEYIANYEKFKDFLLPEDFPVNSDCPCKTAIIDTIENFIRLINPGNDDIENAKKENVGIATRIGFTYGKFTAKIQFPQQINKTNVWNGLTNAFWLIYQDESEWNQRRICLKDGYIPKADPEGQHTRIQYTNYSEIDFEIVKDSKFWSKTSYRDVDVIPTEDPTKSNEIIVACTNWDMACNEPPKYNIGAYDVIAADTSFVFHRWDNWYRATTHKHAVQQTEISSRDYYYYQIEWKPDKIIWRIGPEKDQLQMVAYIDHNYSAIPNNQMIMVVTQEWHFSKWWPNTPFKQEFIPYPKNDLVGRILEIEIE